MSATRFSVGLLVIASMSRPLGAQQPVTIDVGLSAVRFPDEGLTAVGPAVRVKAARTHGSLFASISGAALGTAGSASGYATLEGGARTRLRGGWSTELGAELSSVLGTSVGGGASTAIANGRASWAFASGGSWIHATGSQSIRDQGSLLGRGLDAGVWWTSPRATVAFTVAREWTSAQLFAGPLRTGFSGTTPVGYVDALLSLHAEGDRASLDATAGARRDPDASHIIEPIASATLSLWRTDTRALVVSVARQLPDWVRGADAADAVSIGIRFMQPTPEAERLARVVPVVQVADGTNGRVLRVRATGARRIDVMGDFTEWQEVALTAHGEFFEGAMAVSAGTHHVLVRVDGGAWRPAANTPAVDDDFGGRAGLLVVP